MLKRTVSGIMLTLLFIGMLTLAFNIQPVKADWTLTETIYIRADGSVVPDTAPISSVDNITYTLTDNIIGDVPLFNAIRVERNNIVVDWAYYTLQGAGSVDWAIWLTGRNVTFKKAQIKEFYQGIHLQDQYLTISGNNITNNTDGIYLERVRYNTISGNYITNNTDGIYLHASKYNSISGNYITNNTYGISTPSGNVMPDYNSISGNNITNNDYGIYLRRSSSNNTIYHNNFIDNVVQASIHGVTNVWDNGYPSGGNYWSDYTGIDDYNGPYQNETGSDGIGDTPYVIDADNEDSYPLMNPWTPPADTTLPTISIISPENKTYSVNDVSLTFTVSEPTSWIDYSLDGQLNVTITGNTTLTDLSDETHTLVVYASDLTGNKGSSETVYFTIQTPAPDTTPPEILITSPENRTYTTTDIALTFTLDESVSWMGYSLDGQANVTISGNTTLSGLSDGSHSLIVYARDAAGNTGASGTVSFTIETLPAEPFPIWILAVVIVIAASGTAVYLLKIRKKS